MSETKEALSVHRTERLPVVTRGKDMREITRDVARWLDTIHADEGLLTVFVQHTSASLIIQENADPTVVADLLTSLDKLAPQSADYTHSSEGPDDMPGHIRTMVTGVNASIPVSEGKMMLGRWQGLWLAEHRTRPLQRYVAMHFAGTLHGGTKRSSHKDPSDDPLSVFSTAS